MKLPFFRKISLAVKVGLLFAAAIVFIVSAALFVPWDRMQRLVKEQDLAEARQLATVRLLERCQGRPAPRREAEPAEPAPRTVGASARPVAASGTPSPAATPTPIPTPAPTPATAAASEPDAPDDQPIEQPSRLLRLWDSLRLERHSEQHPRTQLITPLPDAKAAGSGFLGRAIDHFVNHPADTQVYRYRNQNLEYVRALRIKESCAACHVGRTSARPFAADQLVGVIYVQVPAVEPQFWGLPLNLVLVFGAGAIAVTLAVVVFYVITKSVVLHPVRQLRRLADHIGEGDLSVRSTINTGDEFERLAKAFNSMLERLQVAQQRMRQINDSLNSKMDELARANVALFESNRLKSEFLARVSHELRTPLNSIIGFAEVLRDQHAAELSSQPDNTQVSKEARYADNILTSGRMLLDLINDLLDLSKIEAGKMVVRIEKVVVRDLVEAVVNFMRPAAEKKNLTVTVQIDPGLPLADTDGGKFQQILYNLFSNAVKFTPPRGQIELRAWRSGNDLMSLAVADTGPGIPPADQESIFDRFHQLDNPETREHGGTGLGLSISRELANMLGGTITVASKLGEGATFTVTLPLSRAAEDSLAGKKESNSG